MTLKIEVSDQRAAAFRARAASLGLSLEEWLEKLANEKLGVDQPAQNASEVAAHIIELQQHVRPDPEGWNSRDYIKYGRR